MRLQVLTTHISLLLSTWIEKISQLKQSQVATTELSWLVKQYISTISACSSDSPYSCNPPCILLQLLIGSLSFLHKRAEKRNGSPSWLGQKFRNLCDIAAS
jgi:hypothetical protein